MAVFDFRAQSDWRFRADPRSFGFTEDEVEEATRQDAPDHPFWGRMLHAAHELATTYPQGRC